MVYIFRFLYPISIMYPIAYMLSKHILNIICLKISSISKSISKMVFLGRSINRPMCVVNAQLSVDRVVDRLCIACLCTFISQPTGQPPKLLCLCLALRSTDWSTVLLSVLYVCFDRSTRRLMATANF